ncbi:unnamed protein product [Triticum turgidum subsp. durum]|uniref:Uncharacterized protein n=1 Tax=Triticum turgidum subsp. durum TaxID=4567 RepID=A0A9R1BYC7_TRITD|nr:unnamed protein product [Triticum turgidum subsp. durum]
MASPRAWHRRLMGAPASSSPAPSGDGEAAAGRGSSQEAMKIMVSVLVVVIFCTLFYCIYCWRWRKRNAVRRSLLQSLRPMSSSDLPLMDLASIHAATDNFSKANKLGEGGFGPVYRDRGEAAVGAVAAGRGGVPERGGADRQAAAPQPGAAAGLVRRARREAAGVRVPPQPQPRRLPLRRKQERAAGLENPAQHHPGHRPRAALPARGLAAQGRPPGPQGQQRAPRQQDEAQDLRLRHGQDLRGRVHRG